MKDYRKPIKNLLIFAVLSIVCLLLLFIINQVILIVSFTTNIHPLLGRVVLILSTIFFGGTLMIPTVGFILLPKPLIPPDPEDEDAYGAYQNQLVSRLVKNTHLKEKGFILLAEEATMEDIQRGLDLISEKASEIMKTTASKVFLTTAVSQNGALDGIFVLVNLSQMIWRISHLYHQRPSLREIVMLYGNVGATVLMAREIDDLNLLDEQLEPVIASLLGGTLANLVPGATMVTNLIVNSTIEGAANAFLTLRVGAIAKGYCSAVKPVKRKNLRHSATLEACGMMGSIVQEGSVALAKVFLTASKRAATHTASNGRTKVKQFFKNKFISIDVRYPDFPDGTPRI